MATLRLELTKPHNAQWDILSHAARHKVICCGRRFGKTELMTHVLAVGNSSATQGALHGLPVAYFSLSYKNVKEMWQRLKTTLAPITAYKNETDKRLELVTGGVIECWSLEKADNARGRAYAGIVVDEAAIVPDLQYIWDDVLTAMLLDYRGWSLLGSTPKGYNYFYQLYTRGLDPAIADWHAWHYTSYDNPHIAPDELDSVKLTLPQRTWQQEYLADFVEDGGVFRGVGDVSTLARREPYSGRFVFGVDWGRSEDWTVISVLDRETRQQVDADRFNQVSWALQRGRLKALYEKWKPSVIWAESNSIGGVNIEALQDDGLPVRAFQTTAASKAPLIDALALAIERGDVGLLDDPVQKAELQAYQMLRLPSGAYRYSAPDGGHDDTVIALALSWYGVTSGVVEVSFF